MAVLIDNKKVFSLYEVTRSIQKTINERYKATYWIKAEMNKLNYYQHSGHCYPDLIEKKDGKIVAQIRAVLWANDYKRINNTFKNTLNEPLKDGIKILFEAAIIYEPNYGVTLKIHNIDVNYTLGDLEKEKQETLHRLIKEKLADKNKTLSFPLLPKRVAVISVETSKGYADFLKIIDKNPWNYKFDLVLFASLLQGEHAIEAIIKQLNNIKKVMQHFDIVVIIRGGGGDIGLSCYNNYQLAKYIANFPLPVLTGIGHSTNETVVEKIAFFNAITPTKLAEYLIQRFHNFSVPVKNAMQKISVVSKQILLSNKKNLHGEAKLFKSVSLKILNSNTNKLTNSYNTLKNNTINQSAKNQFQILLHQFGNKLSYELQKNTASLYNQINILTNRHLNYISQQNSELNNLNSIIENLHPEKVLNRGYSITYKNEKVISSVAQLEINETITIQLSDGTFEAIITKIHKNEKSSNIQSSI